MELINIATERFDIGRAAIFSHGEVDEYGDVTYSEWDGTTDLFDNDNMIHIGTTEGEVDIAANEEYSDLTIEVTGPAILKRCLAGESPSFEVGMYPDPDKMRAFSPTGTASSGTSRRRLVKVHTLWIVPEELFLADDGTGKFVEVPVTYTGGVWLKNGLPLTAAEQELVDMSSLIWKAQFGRLTPRYNHDEGGKSLKTLPVQVLQDTTKPEGCQLILVMAEADEFAVDFEPGS